MTAFLGYPRADGKVGVRNHLLILAVNGLTAPTGRRIASMIRGSICITQPFGAGLLGEDRAIHLRALEGLVTHPNVGAALIIGADPPKVEAMATAAERAGRLVQALVLDQCDHDALTLTDRGVRAAAGLMKTLSQQRREPVPVSALTLGLECGRSDPSSGLVANPLVGRITDRLVAVGGSAMIGETTEWIGAEHLLAARAKTPEVADAILTAAQNREKLAMDAGLDLTGNNPSQTNIDAGLSSIEEKSLGAIAKSGSAPIEGVLGYGQAPAHPGLWLMDAPAYAPESLTGFAAAGCNLALFTTGVGNSYTSTLMPTIKLSANPKTVSRLDQLDFEAAALFQGQDDWDHTTDRLWTTVLEIASGSLTYGEILGDHDEVISRFGPAL